MRIGRRLVALALAAAAAIFAAAAPQAEPVQIRVGWVVAPGQITPTLFDPPDRSTSGSIRISASSKKPQGA